MFPFILSIATVGFCIYLWIDDKGRAFLYFALGGSIVSAMDLWLFLNTGRSPVANVLTNALIAGLIWYCWKAYRGRYFLILFWLVAVAAVVNVGYWMLDGWQVR